MTDDQQPPKRSRLDSVGFQLLLGLIMAIIVIGSIVGLRLLFGG